MLNTRPVVLPSRKTGRGGFTLVELLVVIGIIAILAAVALPGITGALKKAHESAAQQTANALTLACVQFANDNSGTFPGAVVSPAVTCAGSTDFANILYPTYVSNPDAFYLPMTGKSKMTTAPLKIANVSWDATVSGTANAGLTNSDPGQTPLIFTTGAATVTYGTTGAAAASTATIPVTASPFGTDGLAVGFLDGSSGFKTPATSTATTIVLNSASYTPSQSYTQLKPN